MHRSQSAALRKRLDGVAAILAPRVRLQAQGPQRVVT